MTSHISVRNHHFCRVKLALKDYTAIWRNVGEHVTCSRIVFVIAVGNMKKWYWLVASVAVFGAAIYQVCSIFLQYYEYSVNVSTTFTFQRYAVFPAVTLCNMNPVRQSAISANSPLASLMTSARKKREESRSNADRSRPANHKTRFRYKRSSKSKDTLYSDIFRSSALQKLTVFAAAACESSNYCNTASDTSYCYFIASNNTMTKAAARASCASQGAAVVHIDSSATYNFLIGQLGTGSFSCPSR